jgi:hypothetical protein
MRSVDNFQDIFPRLSTIGTSTEGEEVNLKVHFSKKEGAPVRYVGGDDPAAAAAVGEVDLRKKFYMQRSELARKIGLTQPKAKVLRDFLQIDSDPTCSHVFEFGSQKISCYSDNASRKMRAALEEINIEDLWRGRR